MNKYLRKCALLFSFVIIFAFAVNTTLGFIVAKTDSIVNTFAPFESLNGRLQISKNVEHPFGDDYALPDTLSFDFKVDLGSFYANTTLKTSSGDVLADKNGTIYVCVKPGKTFYVEGVDAGTHVSVTEMVTDGSGFSVKGGCAVQQGIVADDGRLTFEYTNIYTPASVRSTNIFVKGEKTLEGRDWQEGDTFSFALEQMQNDGCWKLLGTKTVAYDGASDTFNRFDFSDLVQSVCFDEAGVYHFRISEMAGDLENIVYDTSVKTFSIEVSDLDMDGRLEINSVTAGQNTDISFEDDKYAVSASFNNTFIPEEKEKEDLPSAPDSTDVPDTPSTSDKSNAPLCAVVLALSTGAFLGVALVNKRRHKKKQIKGQN